MPSRRKSLWVIGALMLVAGVAAASYWAGGASERRGAPETAVSSIASPHQVAPAAQQAAAQFATRHPAAVPPVCHSCGVVESVQTVQRKGDASGIGAVAGGVIGGALGNQVGKGDGRTVMTVLGAIGGGFAGNEVEKRAKSATVYRVRVRTDDGEVRNIEQSQSWAVGQRVRIDGTHLRAIATPAS